MTSVATNFGAIVSHLHSKRVGADLKRSIERLSTGLRVNASSDDAAGLSVSNKMVSQIKGMETAIRNSFDAISLIQTGLSGIREINSMLMRLREIAVQMDNGIYTDVDRSNAQNEVESLLKEISRIADNTSFNRVNILDGSYDNFARAGNTNNETVPILIESLSIFSFIRGASLASGQTTTILRPITDAIGNSRFNTPFYSASIGTSADILALTSSAEGNSNFLTPDSSSASGNSQIVIDLTNNGAGTSSFNTPDIANGAGVSERDISAIKNAAGSSNFSTPGQSFGVGISQKNPINAVNTVNTTDSLAISSMKQLSAFTTVEFKNGDFSDTTATVNGTSVSIPGWDIKLEQVALAPGSTSLTSNIAGFPTPVDDDIPPQSPGDDAAAPTSFSYRIVDGELGLTVNNLSFRSYAQIHGPYVVSQAAIALEAGDTVSFDYFAEAGGDYYDVYGYLLNTATGDTTELLNETGPSSFRLSDPKASRNTTKTVTVDASGDYKFVFISGSFDATGGRYMGGSLFISNINVVQANPPPSNITTSAVSINVEEATLINIEKQVLSSLDSIASGDNYSGNYEILDSGLDEALFSISDTAPNKGTISANGLSFNPNGRNSYKFDVRYTGVNGNENTETVEVNITEKLQSTATVSADEANRVTINNGVLSTIADFARRDNYRGSYSLSDNVNFSISQNGTITSRNVMEFDDQKTYSFNVLYRAQDGRVFTEAVTLNLEDTLSSSASLEAEEADKILIGAGVLESSTGFAAKYNLQGITGTYDIVESGSDWRHFTINPTTGAIESKTNSRLMHRSLQDNYNFQISYTTTTGITHVETVNLRLTEALQSTATVSAHEANRVTINNGVLSTIADFARRDNYRGSYSLSDNVNFSISQNGTITSRNVMEFDDQKTYSFNVLYRAQDGRVFTEAVTLNLEDTLSSSASLEAEEADKILIGAGVLESSTGFAAKYNLQGITGTYDIVESGSDWRHFTINPTTGAIESKTNSRLMHRSLQDNYNFQISYTTTTGITHVETVNLRLTEALQSTATVSAHEANRVTVNNGVLSSIADFARRDNYRGSYSLSDNVNFSISENGTITSRNVMEFDDQKTYSFNVLYRAQDGRVFTEAVTLNLDDTLSSSASLKAEQSKSLEINLSTLSSSHAFASKKRLEALNNGAAQGYFELDNGVSGFNQFNVNASTGKVTSRVDQLISEAEKKKFVLRYVAWDGQVHEEVVNLQLTDSLQARTVTQAPEANKVAISKEDISKIIDFARNDRFGGRFNLAQQAVPGYANPTSDYLKFQVSQDGQITSKTALDFDLQSNFEFDLVYEAQNGKTFRQDIKLTLKDTLTGTSKLRVEEGQQVVIRAFALDGIKDFKQKVENPNDPSSLGTFEFVSINQDSDKFSITDGGLIQSTEEIRKSDRDHYDLAVKYTAKDGRTFVQNISLDVTDTTYNKAHSELAAKESAEVRIAAETLYSLNEFALNDSFLGTFSLKSFDPANQDQELFQIDEYGNILSREELDFEKDKLEYKFVVEYVDSVSGDIYTNSVFLSLKNDTKDDSTLDLANIGVTTQELAKDAATLIDAAIKKTTVTEAELGAVQNRLTHSLNNQAMGSLLTKRANGRIIDADYAIETAALAKSQILQDAATAMLTIAKSTKDNFLMLVR